MRRDVFVCSYAVTSAGLAQRVFFRVVYGSLVFPFFYIVGVGATWRWIAEEFKGYHASYSRSVYGSPVEANTRCEGAIQLCRRCHRFVLGDVQCVTALFFLGPGTFRVNVLAISGVGEKGRGCTKGRFNLFFSGARAKGIRDLHVLRSVFTFVLGF